MTQSSADESAASEEKQYDCPRCKDKTGYIEQRERGDGYGYDEFWKVCSCVEWRKAQRLMKSSEITEAFRRLSFENFATENKPGVIVDAYECAAEYYDDFEEIKEARRNSIALLGQPGAGKTHLLTAVANRLIQKFAKAKDDRHDTGFIPVLYFPFVEGFTDLRDDFDKLEEKLTRMKNAGVLFIDDLYKPTGRERKPRATEWQIEQMYAVINHRYLNHKPIMVSSELTIDELCDVDEALGTRIYEMCQDYTVVIKGDRRVLNHRLEGAPE